MLLKQTSLLTTKVLGRAIVPLAWFSSDQNKNVKQNIKETIKDKIEDLIKADPKVILQDAAQSQSAIVEGYDAGMNNFISKVYMTTGFGILITAAGVAMATSLPYFSLHPFRAVGYGLLGTAAGLSSAYMIRPETVVQQNNGKTKLYTQNTFFRLALFGFGWLSNGIMWMPIFNMLSAMFPLVLPSFAMLSLGCFGGAAVALRLLPKHYLARYSGMLGGFAGGLLSLGALSFFKSLFGQLYVDSGITMLDSSIGLSIFMILTWYNTRQAVKSYKNGQADHLATSIAFLYKFLQFIRRSVMYIFKR